MNNKDLQYYFNNNENKNYGIILSKHIYECCGLERCVSDLTHMNNIKYVNVLKIVFADNSFHSTQTLLYYIG